MRKLEMLLCGVALSLAAGAAGAETLYRWTNADGVVAFSDELKRIPEAYRAGAVKVETANLSSYTRYTPANPTQGAAYEQELAARTDRRRELNAAAAADTAKLVAPATGPSLGQVRVNGKLSLALPAGQAASDEPIVVEEHRVRMGGCNHARVRGEAGRQGPLRRAPSHQFERHELDEPGRGDRRGGVSPARATPRSRDPAHAVAGTAVSFASTKRVR